MTEIYFPMDHTPAEWRAMAGRNYQEASDSFDRCDTDGFLSQWASNTMAGLYLHLAKLAETNGVTEMRWLFDNEGNPIENWRWIETRYGSSVLIPGESYGNGTFFNPSHAAKAERREKADRAKGYTFGTVETEVVVKLTGNNVTVYPVNLRKKGADLKVIETASYSDR